MAFISEAEVEEMLLGYFEALGYSRLADTITGPDGTSPERETYADVLLIGRLAEAVDRLVQW